MTPRTDLPDTLGVSPELARLGIIPLSIKKGVDVDGQNYVQSHWKPSKEELDILIEGGYVSVNVMGATSPPIYITSTFE